jgi:hypothetical protein
MLIRLKTEELVEYPNELGALVLADPREGDVPDFTPDLVNCLIHDALVPMFNQSLTHEQNIADATAHFTQIGAASEANLKKARALIADYNKNIAQDAVGYVDRNLMGYLYFSHNADDANTAQIIDRAKGLFDALADLNAELTLDEYTAPVPEHLLKRKRKPESYDE